MMRTTPHLKTSERGSAVTVSVPTRLVSLLLLATLAPLGLVVAGLIWLEDGGPVFTGSLLEATSETSQLPSFRVATLHLEKWDIRKLPASVGSPERLILIPTLTVIGRILTRSYGANLTNNAAPATGDLQQLTHFWVSPQEVAGLD